MRISSSSVKVGKIPSFSGFAEPERVEESPPRVKPLTRCEVRVLLETLDEGGADSPDTAGFDKMNIDEDHGCFV